MPIVIIITIKNSNNYENNNNVINIIYNHQNIRKPIAINKGINEMIATKMVIIVLIVKHL